MNMDLLKQQQNRGYIIAGIGGIVGFIAFFLPYYSFFIFSISGSSVGWLWFEFLAALVAIGVSAVLIFRNNAFGLTNMPVEKQILYGRYALIGAGAVGILFQLIALSYLHEGLAFGYFLYWLAAIAMVVGGVLAYRTPMPAAAQSWQYPQSTAYPPYQQQPYPPQAPYQQPYPPTEQPPQQYPQQQYPSQQQPPQQYPQQPPQQQPPQW